MYSVRILCRGQRKPVLCKPPPGLPQLASLCISNVVPYSPLHVSSGCLQEREETTSSIWRLDLPNLDYLRLLQVGKDGRSTGSTS